MKWALIVIGVVAAILAIVVIVGALQPRDHVVTMTARIAAPPNAVWTTITDASAFPSWRRDVTSVDRLPVTPTGPSWREHSRSGTLTMVVDSADPPHRLVTHIADVGLPFGGRWIYDIAPDNAGGSFVTITEQGSVYNPVFRFVSRFIMGHTATIDAYLRALGRKFGNEPTPTVVGPTAAGGARGT
jgi:uncharacterized protein YndB with AHSA1/START domain